MTKHVLSVERAGHSNVPAGEERSYTFLMKVNDRPGSVDRIIGLLRRRRANVQTLILERGTSADMARITVTGVDSEVGVHHVIEQLRKNPDVQDVLSLETQHTVMREMALVKVNASAQSANDIIEYGLSFGAHVVDMTPETITLEITGSTESIEKLIEQLQEFGIREIARSGCVAMTRSA